MTCKKEAPKHAQQAKKLPYHAPRLVVHGDLRTLTKVKGGTAGDAGKPATRASGSPG